MVVYAMPCISCLLAAPNVLTVAEGICTCLCTVMERVCGQSRRMYKVVTCPTMISGVFFEYVWTINEYFDEQNNCYVAVIH